MSRTQLVVPWCAPDLKIPRCDATNATRCTETENRRCLISEKSIDKKPQKSFLSHHENHFRIFAARKLNDSNKIYETLKFFDAIQINQ